MNPSRFRKNGAQVRISSDPMELTNVISPLCNAETPNPIWNIIGSRNGIAPTAIRDSEPHCHEIRNVFTRNSRKSSIGLGTRRACSPYNPAATTPTATSTATGHCAPIPRLATSIPNIRHDSAVPASTNPSKSNVCRTGSVISSMNAVTSTIPMIPIGTLM